MSSSRVSSTKIRVRVQGTTAGDGTALDVFELQDGAGAPYGQAEPRRQAQFGGMVRRLDRRADQLIAVHHDVADAGNPAFRDTFRAKMRVAVG